MTRGRHRLDLLPLLDVFMVVLFAFATIQEQRLGETTRDAEQAREHGDALAQQLAEAQRELHAREAADDTDEELERMRERTALAERRLAELQSTATATIASLSAGDDPVRRRSVLGKLLDRYGVFELEIAGDAAPDGAVVNRCCFRTDPLSTTWQSCGEIPAVSSARLEWWEGGGGGLAAALRRTKGGNAMTIIRQDAQASYHIAAGMEDLLRDRFPDHQIYDEGVSLVEIHCGD